MSKSIVLLSFLFLLVVTTTAHARMTNLENYVDVHYHTQCKASFIVGRYAGFSEKTHLDAPDCEEWFKNMLSLYVKSWGKYRVEGRLIYTAKDQP